MASSCIRLPSTGVAAAKPPLPKPSPSSSHIVASFSSQCSTKSRGADLSVAFRIECRSSFSANQPNSLYRSRSAEFGQGDRKQRQVLRRAASADFLFFHDDIEFAKNLEELALGGNPGDLKREFNKYLVSESAPSTSSYSGAVSATSNHTWELSGGFGPATMAIPPGGIANNCELPASLRLIKQKKKNQRLAGWEESFQEVGESARCSVYKAFSSMVFMISELQSYTIHMREGLFYEDIQQILSRVQQDMHASFVWLFQQIFSSTPTLMVSVMLLLANFTVYSMTGSTAMAAPMSQPQVSVVSVVESSTNSQQKTNLAGFDQTPAVNTFSSVREASVRGSSDGGGKVIMPVAGAADDGRSEGPSSSQKITHAGSASTVPADEDVASVSEEDEEDAWNHMVEEARQMQASFVDESFVDPNVLKWMVNPVTVEVEPDAYVDYQRTDLDYQLAVQMDPHNSLLLANFAHFLQVVLRDYERAEYFYKKAIACVPVDGEAFIKYANFLWLIKNDIEAAEENYLKALIADSGNSYHAASYAHFLWNTGGTDTCFIW